MSLNRAQRRAILHDLVDGRITVAEAEAALNLPTAPRHGPAITPSPLLSTYRDQYGRPAAGSHSADAWGRRWEW